MTRKLISEISFVLLASLALCLSLALFSFDTRDPGFAYVGHDITVRNWLGPAGAMIASFMFTVIGWMAYTIPLLILQLAIKLLRSRLQQNMQVPMLLLQTLAYVLLFLAACGVLSLHFDSQLTVSAGGGVGLWVNERLFPVLAMVGTTAVELTVLMITLTLIYRISWVAVIDVTGEAVLRAASWASAQQMPTAKMGPWRQRLSHWWQKKQRVKPPRKDPALDPLMSGDPLLGSASPERSLVQPSPPSTEQAPQPASVDDTPPSAPKPRQAPSSQPKQLRIEPLRSEPMFTTDEAEGDSQEHGSDMQLPALELLHQPVQPKDAGYSETALEEMGELLIARLKEFGVKAEMDAICPGPVITRFEIRPAPGTKASKISNLAKDLARSMAMVAVRVVEVIPGKSTVGIEVPNANRATVGLRGVLASNAFQHAASSVAMGIGHDIAGQPVVADLAKMPHLLVAGTTGSGKSVGVNSMLVSMLYKSTPDQLKLILIDPKMLELSVYEGIPHLLTPVVTDMNDAAQALRWCVGEMERRYQLMSKVGVRNLAGFNSKVSNANAAGEPIPDPLFDPSTALDPHNVPTLEKLPQIVVVIDEFADMMMIVGKKCEELIARIAQKARAAGIHLILATQRPSVDVITGLIKANIPTRMAFQVSSKIDSRTILDQGGAEQLLGHGDMLYMPPGTSMPIRVHGAFVSDEDVHHVVDAWKAQGEAQYIDEILQEDALPEGGMLTGLTDTNASDSESDPLFDEAVFVVTKHRKASISFVQRQLRVGYNRAARLVETMEAAGVVSAAEHNGSRSVLAPPPAEV